MIARGTPALRTWDWDACFARGVPMFAPYAPIAARWRTLRDFPALAELGRAWRAVGAPGLAPSRASLAIEPARALKAIDYERRIVRDGALGLREGSWHDLMNLLVWCRFPCAKLALSQAHVQAAALAGPRGGGPRAAPIGRGARRDALTLFDESGIVLVCADPQVGALLRARRWQELFEQRRDALHASARFVLFGHGLLERARHPFPGLTGRTLIIDDADAATIAALDTALAAVAPGDGLVWSAGALAGDVGAAAEAGRAGGAALWRDLDARVAAAVGTLCRPAQLAPLPVLGVPGWWPGNEVPGFYADTRWFRPERTG